MSRQENGIAETGLATFYYTIIIVSTQIQPTAQFNRI
jgi:hypothetical protein